MTSYVFMLRLNRYVANIIYSITSNLVSVNVKYNISNDSIYHYEIKLR